jgi:hypothetical protein
MPELKPEVIGWSCRTEPPITRKPIKWRVDFGINERLIWKVERGFIVDGDKKEYDTLDDAVASLQGQGVLALSFNLLLAHLCSPHVGPIFGSLHLARDTGAGRRVSMALFRIRAVAWFISSLWRWSDAVHSLARCGWVRRWPLASSHRLFGYAPQVGQGTASICF